MSFMRTQRRRERAFTVEDLPTWFANYQAIFIMIDTHLKIEDRMITKKLMATLLKMDLIK